MTLRKQQCSLDGQCFSQDVGASEESNLLQFFNPYVARDLTCVLLKTFLDESKCSYYNWNWDVFISHIFVTSISRSLYLDSFSTSLIDTFLVSFQSFPGVSNTFLNILADPSIFILIS